MKNKIKILPILLVILVCCALALVGCHKDGNTGNGDNHTYYTVTFDSRGGSAVESQRIAEGNPIKRPDLPSYDGYNFLGWYEDEVAKDDLWNFDTDRVQKDMTLYAGWQKITEVGEPTASLVYQREGDTYIVTGVGEETEIVIPSEHDGLPVVAIRGDYGNGAFARKNIVSVVIPDSIIEIGQNTFNNCKNLVSVTIGTNSSLAKIGNNAFSGCSSLEEIYLPAAFFELGDSVFNNCGSLKNFTVAQDNTAFRSENGHLIERTTNTLIRGGHNAIVPDGVMAIEKAAFRRTTGITELSIPVSVTTIGNFFIADSTITTVRYQGTETEWNAIEKSSSMWNYGNRDVKVVFEKSETPTLEPTPTGNKILIAYFSCTNNTENIAKHIETITGGVLYEITPKVPYTNADLNYNTDCRANREQNDSTARPEISGSVENMSQYDIVFIGYPIWWGQAPKILYTFLENYEFAGKTIIPFCTSGSSGIGSSATNLKSSAPDATWLSGQRFSGSASKATVENWINGLNLNIQKEQEMKISVKSNNIEIIYKLNDSKAAKDLYAQLPLTIVVEPYSNNEIIFYPQTLDTSDAPLAEGGAGTLAYYAPWGDVVLFYGSFSSNGSLFELGKIVSGIENIKNLTGTVTITAC